MRAGETDGCIALIDGTICMYSNGVFGYPQPTPQPRLAVVACFGIELHSSALPEKTPAVDSTAGVAIASGV